eukprot:gene15545-18426_t
MVEEYVKNTLIEHKTTGLMDIKADTACVGIYAYGQCPKAHDIFHEGDCGFCYGDSGTDGSLSTENALFFRMISDVYALEGTKDARCPALGNPWTWNDWRPILGENAWASLLGPLQSAFLAADGKADEIPDDSFALVLASNFLPAVRKLLIPNVGCVHYTAHNSYGDTDPDVGGLVSTENNGSLLAGLKALRYVLNAKVASQFKGLLAEVDSLIESVEGCLKQAYDTHLGFFLQGGRYNLTTREFEWNPGTGATGFAVDCQTWVMSALGKARVDAWFGEGTALKVWNKTAEIGGYKVSCDSGRCIPRGVGFSDNKADQVFSGEWTFGAINLLRILSAEYENIDPTMAIQLQADADGMREQITQELTVMVDFDRTPPAPEKQGDSSKAVKYANKRY